jgi:hypothetical protein
MERSIWERRMKDETPLQYELCDRSLFTLLGVQPDVPLDMRRGGMDWALGGEF